MGKGQILLYAALIPVSLLTTGVVAPPASAAGCKVEDDRAQTYSGLGYRTTAFGKKVTCDVGTTRRYAMIITCDPNNGANYTLHGKTVSAPEKSSVLCTDRGLFEFPDNVVDYYIRWS